MRFEDVRRYQRPWHRSWRSPLWILAGLLISANAGAVTLSGLTTDAETGETLPYTSVYLSGEGIRRATLSGAAGDYELVDVPTGSFLIRFSRIGYRAAEDSIVIRTDMSYDAALVVEAVRVDKVVVTGDRFRSEKSLQTSFVTLNAQRLASLPAVGEIDPIRSLQQLPGVQATSDISSGLYVRGGGPDQTLILLDRVPVYNPTHAFGFFSTFNADAVEQVKLYKGAYPAQYGGRLGAVLDVENREGDGNGFGGRAGLSTITGRLLLEGPLGNGSYILSLRRTYLEPLLNAIRNEENQIPRYYFYDANGKVVLKSSSNDRITLSLYRGQDVLRLDPDEDAFVDLRWGNQLLAAKYDRIFGDGIFGAFQISGSEYETETDAEFFTTPISFRNRIRDISLRTDWVYEASPSQTWRAGFVSTSYDFAFDESFNGQAGIQFESRPFDLSTYLDNEWKLDERTAVRGGIRLRYFSPGKRTFVEPRLTASRSLSDRLRLKLAGGIYHQYVQLVSTEGLSAVDFYLPVDETAEPGRSWQSVLGLDWDVSGAYDVSAELYYTRLGDVVEFNNDLAADRSSAKARDIFRTGGKGYATGLELFLERGVRSLTGWLGYTLGYTRREFADLNGGRSFPPKYDRRHDLKAVANYRRGTWTYGASFVYATGQAFTPAEARYALRNPATGEYVEGGQFLPGERNSGRLLPYHRLDVSVTKDFSFFGQSAQWVFQVFNVYSRRNEWFVQYDTDDLDKEPKVVKMLPIIPSLGLKVDF
jgi:hypothetical protein